MGKGAFGQVNVAVHKLTEELAAVKLCDRKRVADAQARRCLNQEVSVLQRLNGHPNVVQLYEVFETSSHVVLVMELAPGGDLLRYVRQKRVLTEPCAKELFKQLMDGIRYIHGMGVVHRDIKLENLLLDGRGCVKIADFGVAAFVKGPGHKLTDHCGTPSYIAPEVLLEAGYEGPPVDVWSAGVVLYAMLCGRVPFKGEQFSDLKRCIVAGQFSLPPQLGEAATALLRALLVVDPATRLTVPGALSHAWLEGVRSRDAADFDPERCIVPDEKLLGKMCQLGFSEAAVAEAVRERKMNHSAATYHLLARQRARRANREAVAAAFAGFEAAQGDQGRHLNEHACKQET